MKLLSGYDNGNRAREFVHHLAEAIRYKIKNMLVSGAGFSLLCDGSQARKTKSEKELVLVRCVKDGQPVFLTLALQNIDDYGDATADHLKASLDDLFQDLNVPADVYSKLMVSVIADGASVNFGVHNGLLTQLVKADRPWLLTVHCICHRVELAIKDSLLKVQLFADIKDILISIYYLMKRSGKFLRHFEETGQSMSVHVYRFPKVHGTRFLDHLRKGVKVLLHNWVPLLNAIENSVAARAHSTVNAKLLGILKKLSDLRLLATAVLLRSILDSVAALSLKFQTNQLLAFEVAPAVEVVKGQLSDLTDEDDLLQHSLLAAGIEVVDGCMSTHLPKPGHMRRKPEHREFIEVSYDKMKFNGKMEETINSLSAVVPTIIACLSDRFSTFDADIFQKMRVLDRSWWTDDSKDEVSCLQFLAEHFKVTLAVHAFDATKLKREWKDAKLTIKQYYPATLGFHELWLRILQGRRSQFPNLCLLIEVIMVVGVSNSSVESCFSFLTAMLSDRRLSLSHQSMADLLLIRANHTVWSDNERQDIIEAALTSFTSKRRKRADRGVAGPTRNAFGEPTAERGHQETPVPGSESDSESDSDSALEYDSSSSMESVASIVSIDSTGTRHGEPPQKRVRRAAVVLDSDSDSEQECYGNSSSSRSERVVHLSGSSDSE